MLCCCPRSLRFQSADWEGRHYNSDMLQWSTRSVWRLLITQQQHHAFMASLSAMRGRFKGRGRRGRTCFRKVEMVVGLERYPNSVLRTKSVACGDNGTVARPSGANARRLYTVQNGVALSRMSPRTSCTGKHAVQATALGHMHGRARAHAKAARMRVAVNCDAAMLQGLSGHRAGVACAVVHMHAATVMHACGAGVDTSRIGWCLTSASMAANGHAVRFQGRCWRAAA